MSGRCGAALDTRERQTGLDGDVSAGRKAGGQAGGRSGGGEQADGRAGVPSGSHINPRQPGRGRVAQ